MFKQGDTIHNLDELKQACLQENVSGDGTGVICVYIALAGGLARSSKTVQYYSNHGTWDVLHDISDEWEEDLSDEYMANEMFGEAFEKGALKYLMRG